jgi:hypothetical protein
LLKELPTFFWQLLTFVLPIYMIQGQRGIQETSHHITSCIVILFEALPEALVSLLILTADGWLDFMKCHLKVARVDFHVQATRATWPFKNALLPGLTQC